MIWLRTRTAVVMLAPALAIYVLIVLYPMIRGLQLSLTSSTGVGQSDFVGLANYRRMLTDPEIPAALRTTILFTVLVVGAQNAIAIALASLLHRLPAVRSFARIGLLVPSMLSIVVVGYVWSYIYSPLDGPLNATLEAVGLSGLTHVWLGERSTALIAIAVANIWMFTGYSTAIYLANYVSIPAEIFEAASVDGASGWRRFRQIELPLLAPSVTVNLAISTIGTLKVFEFPFVMTNGGPAGATKSLAMVIYQQAFRNYQFGYATAVAVVLLVLTLLVAIVQVSLLRRREVRA